MDDASPQGQDATAGSIDRRMRLAELIIKYLAILSTVFGGLFALFQYVEASRKESDQQVRSSQAATKQAAKDAEIRHDREKAAEENRREAEKAAVRLRLKEFQLSFFQKEMDLYIEACRTAGTLASASDPTDEAIQKEIDRFYTLYWGPLSVVEDRGVERAMVEFEAALRAWQAGGGKATEEMRTKSYELAHECRKSMNRTFDLNLDALPGKPDEAARAGAKPVER